MPLTITFALAWWMIGIVDDYVVPLIPDGWNPDQYLRETVGLEVGLPGLGVIVLLVVITLIGALTAGIVGRMVVNLGERILARMPVVRNVYSAVKQILETVLADHSAAFREAVLVEYPRRGIWAIAFITGRTEGEVQNVTEEECINIFLPTTPNPTSGYLLFVPKKDLVALSMTVEEAIKMVISGGIITPPDHRAPDQQDVPLTAAHTYEEMDILREKERAPVLVPKGTRPGEKQIS